MVHALNWEEVEQTLFNGGQAALLRFATEHSDEICSFFAFAWMIVDGDFSVCLDTLSNARSRAREHEREAIESRKKILRGENAWRSARSLLTEPKIVTYAPAADLFAYAPYANIFLEDWEAFSNFESTPKSQAWEEGYLEGNTRLVLWRVLERLIDSDTFSHLRLSSPFHVGYQFHDQELVVLRILNWSKVEDI